MNTFFSIEPHWVHIWKLQLSEFFPKNKLLLSLLNTDEKTRYDRYSDSSLAKKFLITRAILHLLLRFYTHSLENSTLFYSEKGKPFLKNNPLDVVFNLSHSKDFAVFAFTRHNPVGIDIEYIDSTYSTRIIQRYFCKEEQEYFYQQAEADRTMAFFRLWTRKEALAKALDQKLLSVLSTQSVLQDSNPTFQIETLSHYIPGYQLSLATQEIIFHKKLLSLSADWITHQSNWIENFCRYCYERIIQPG